MTTAKSPELTSSLRLAPGDFLLQGIPALTDPLSVENGILQLYGESCKRYFDFCGLGRENRTGYSKQLSLRDAVWADIDAAM